MKELTHEEVRFAHDAIDALQGQSDLSWKFGYTLSMIRRMLSPVSDLVQEGLSHIVKDFTDRHEDGTAKAVYVRDELGAIVYHKNADGTDDFSKPQIREGSSPIRDVDGYHAAQKELLKQKVLLDLPRLTIADLEKEFPETLDSAKSEGKKLLGSIIHHLIPVLDR